MDRAGHLPQEIRADFGIGAQDEPQCMGGYSPHDYRHLGGRELPLEFELAGPNHSDNRLCGARLDHSTRHGAAARGPPHPQLAQFEKDSADSARLRCQAGGSFQQFHQK